MRSIRSSLYQPAGFFRYESDGKWASLAVPDGKRVESLASRESVFLVNNLLLTAFTFTVTLSAAYDAPVSVDTTSNPSVKAFRAIPFQKWIIEPTIDADGISSWKITTEDGTQFTFAARPGVCGNGRSFAAGGRTDERRAGAAGNRRAGRTG